MRLGARGLGGFSHAPTLVHTRMQKNKMAELQNPDLPAPSLPMHHGARSFCILSVAARYVELPRIAIEFAACVHANELKIAFESQSKDRNALRLPFRAFGFVMAPPARSIFRYRSLNVSRSFDGRKDWTIHRPYRVARSWLLRLAAFVRRNESECAPSSSGSCARMRVSSSARECCAFEVSCCRPMGERAAVPWLRVWHVRVIRLANNSHIENCTCQVLTGNVIATTPPRSSRSLNDTSIIRLRMEHWQRTAYSVQTRDGLNYQKNFLLTRRRDHSNTYRKHIN